MPPSPTLTHINTVIRTARTRNGRYITSRDLANVTSLSASTWRRVLGGGSNLHVTHLEMLRDALTELTDDKWQLAISLQKTQRET